MEFKYQIGWNKYKTKSQVFEVAKKYLYSFELGKIPSSAAYEIQWLKDLFATHEDAAIRLPKGVLEIHIVKGGYNTRCFAVLTENDTLEDFSYKKCLSTAPTSRHRMFRNACRQAVDDQITAFRGGAAKSMHVDHVAPQTFEKLVRTFCQLHDIDINKVEYDYSARKGAMFVDPNLVRAFSHFHRHNAVLRLIPKSLNISLPKTY